MAERKRKRLLCESEKQFGKVTNPCRKILCEVYAEEIIEEDDEGNIVLVNAEKIIFKCSCKSKKTIKLRRA